MSTLLRVLLVEDSEDDALLVASALRDGGYDLVLERIESMVAMRAALKRGGWDIVISDHRMPGFTSGEALQLVQTSEQDLPFIIVSGTMGEEVAVAAMKAGAHDFLIKGDLARLVPAVERELREAVVRRERARAERALLESEARFRGTFNQAAVGMAHVDSDGAIMLANSKFCEILGYSINEIGGLNFTDLVSPDDLQKSVDYRRQLAEGKIEVFSLEKRYIQKDKTAVWVSVTVSAVQDVAGKFQHYIVVTEDISARKTAEERIRRSEANLAAAQRITHLGSWELVLDDGEDVNKNALQWSEETFRIFGYQPGGIEVSNDNFFLAVHPDDRAGVAAGAMRALKEGIPYSIEHRIIRPDGSERIVQEMSDVEYHPVSGRALRMIGTVQDITERRRYEAQIEYLATHDRLTDLPNRNLLNDRLAQFIARAVRTNGRIAVLLLDIDRFKFINDSLGHGLGDTLLQEVALRLKKVMREDDTLARLGGDEFVVVLADLSGNGDAVDAAQRLLKTLSGPFLAGGERDLHITGSVGVSIYPDDGISGDVLLRNADAAMYRAKERGRDTFEFYAEEMSIQAQERVELESALRRALENQEFELHYQPQVNLSNGKIIGVEALIRWKHPQFGIVSPGRFIPLAEETGMILPIGEWVLRTACTQAKLWHELGYPELSLAVNFSVRQCHQPGVSQLVQAVLDETGLNPARLEIELTESTLMQDSGTIATILQEFKTIGVTVSLDDFGTGYSSLSCLKRFPIDTLKIDKSFIDDVAKRADDAAIVKVIIDMARSLKMRTIAEGVETEDQRNFLKANGCDAMQGYYFSRPLLAKAIAALLTGGVKMFV